MFDFAFVIVSRKQLKFATATHERLHIYNRSMLEILYNYLHIFDVYLYLLVNIF
jgi:hypothetical protein